MKNRTAIGIVCIILAVAVTFVVSPLVNNVSDKKTEIVRFANDVSHGTEIKDSDVEVVKISTSSLPAKVIKDKTAVNESFYLTIPRKSTPNSALLGKRLYIKTA